jgi:hypothetical protein
MRQAKFSGRVDPKWSIETDIFIATSDEAGVF